MNNLIMGGLINHGQQVLNGRSIGLSKISKKQGSQV